MRAQTISLSGRRKKKLQRQVEKYLNALKTHRNDYKIHMDLGDAYAELKDVRKGVKSYYGAIDLLRQAPNISKTKNQIIELYEKIVEMSPDEYRAYTELSEEYIAAGQKEKAFRFLLTSAKKAYEEENYELALQCYNQAIAKGRTNPHIVERCTELYIKLGRKEEAMQNYIQIGDMYAQEEKNIEALEYYKKACLLEPENPELLLKVARMYNAMAWTENAASELVKVGEHYEHNHEYTEALRYYNYSVRLDPENERAQEGRVRINQSPSVDGLVMTDTADSASEQDQADVLEQLDQIDGTEEGIPISSATGEFELTPLDGTLTFEDDAVTGDLTGSDDDEELQMIILDDEVGSSVSEEDHVAADVTDSAAAFILDEGQMIDQPPPTEETLWFPDTDEQSEAGAGELEDAELLLPTQSAEDAVAPDLHVPTNIFRMEDNESEMEGEFTTPDILSTPQSDENEDTAGHTADLFAVSEEEDSPEGLLLEPDMLPEADTEEPLLNDLQPFETVENQGLPNEAETLVMENGISDEASPFDEDLFAPDANILPPSNETSFTDTTSISLEDWIIDLKEDELVELALEEALREQEQEAAANWEELLGLEPSSEEAILSDGTPLSLPEESLLSASPEQFQELGSADDIIDIRAETASPDEHPEIAQEESQEIRGETPPETLFDGEQAEAPEPLPNNDDEAEIISEAQWVGNASEEALNMYLDEESVTEEPESSSDLWFECGTGETLDVYLEGDQSDTSVDESVGASEDEPFAAEDSDADADEIVLEIDASDETLQDFVANNNGVRAFLNEEEVSEEDDKIGVSLIDDTLLNGGDDEFDMFADTQGPPENQDIDKMSSNEVSLDDITLDETVDEAALEETALNEAITFQVEASQDEEPEESEAIAEDEEIDFPMEADVSEDISEDVSQNQTVPADFDESPEDDVLQQSIEVAEMTQLLEESDIDEILAEHAPHEGNGALEISGDIRDLHMRIEDLEQQLERTEEEKYFLQERFAAQISQHKAHEESLQREIADVYRDKAELEKQLHVPSDDAEVEIQIPSAPQIPSTKPVPSAKVAPGVNASGFDNDRYNALIDKIDQKKTRIQQQLHKLLKKREENGRYLNQELDVLGNTKRRLQQNLEYIQQVKARVEEKVNTELRQAKEEVQSLTNTTKTLETRLRAQGQQEQELRRKFTILRQEKEQLQQEYGQALSELQHEKTGLEQQLQQLSQAKYTGERKLKKKLQTLHRSYQQLKGEYKTVIELKDAQLAENAQKLNDVSSKYKKLEKILAEIRKERTRLNARLTKEISVRESLEEKLVSIENHVHSLDAQESKMVKQLGHELERHFTMKQSVSDKFHLSLDEFEGLLALQEKEIRTLEAI